MPYGMNEVLPAHLGDPILSEDDALKAIVSDMAASRPGAFLRAATYRVRSGTPGPAEQLGALLSAIARNHGFSVHFGNVFTGPKKGDSFQVVWIFNER